MSVGCQVRVSGGCLEGVLRVSEGSMEGVLRVSGGCQEGVRKVSMTTVILPLSAGRIVMFLSFARLSRASFSFGLMLGLGRLAFFRSRTQSALKVSASFVVGPSSLHADSTPMTYSLTGISDGVTAKLRP